jgi:hypothetical protein
MTDDIAFESLISPLQFYPIPNEKGRSDSDQSVHKKPNIEANIIRLKMLRSPSVLIDGATASLGFVAHRQLYFRFTDL